MTGPGQAGVEMGLRGAVGVVVLAAFVAGGCGEDAATQASDGDATPTTSAVFNQQNSRGYSMASTYGGLVWTAGHLPETTGENGDMRAQTQEVMEALETTLTEAGASFDTVLMTNAYLADFDDWPVFNAVYTEFFGDRLPPRVTVEVASLAWGKIEISMVAHVQDDETSPPEP